MLTMDWAYIFMTMAANPETDISVTIKNEIEHRGLMLVVRAERGQCIANQRWVLERERISEIKYVENLMKMLLDNCMAKLAEVNTQKTEP